MLEKRFQLFEPFELLPHVLVREPFFVFQPVVRVVFFVPVFQRVLFVLFEPFFVLKKRVLVLLPVLNERFVVLRPFVERVVVLRVLRVLRVFVERDVLRVPVFVFVFLNVL